MRAAIALRDAAPEVLEVDVRAGVHTGECEPIGAGVGGIGVHIAARVQASAEPGQVLVSNTVKDLVVGSGLRFTDAGERKLKGVPGAWRPHVVTGDDEEGRRLARTSSAQVDLAGPPWLGFGSGRQRAKRLPGGS